MFDYRTEDKNKNDRVVVRVTKKEKEYLKNYCKEKNMTISEYIYNLVTVDITMFKK